ncbi:hypothetical protein CKAN_02585200 [Cinnamomum micranthum f. kanehirae]|uniref:Transmembrane protein n=1 Tax=Cinnamomum micranthum f. kanehirae TaxID=337451 RepID=A0A443Q0D7_9MAGN|nr:hypothetical protein CKAN_02585200 [Cinnamomum micranthum f. kanehirae]
MLDDGDMDKGRGRKIFAGRAEACMRKTHGNERFKRSRTRNPHFLSLLVVSIPLFLSLPLAYIYSPSLPPNPSRSRNLSPSPCFLLLGFALSNM